MVLFSSMALPAGAQVNFSKTNYHLQAAPAELVTADVNDDDKPDLVVLSIVSGDISILLNNGDGTFASSIDFPAGTNPLGAFPNAYPSFAVADLNGDKRLDLIVSNPANPGSPAGPSVNVLLGRGDGTFQPPAISALDFHYPILVGVGDFNGDKKPDVALFGTDTAISLVMLLGNGNGTFTRHDFPLPSAHGPVNVVADFNQDGKLDVAYSLDNSFVDLFLGKGDATFQSPLQIALDAFGPSFLGSGDFNHDGQTDLVWTSNQSQTCEFRSCHNVGPPGSLQAMLGNGNGTFTGPGALDHGDFGFAAVADFDGDGNLDIAANGNLPSPSFETKIYLGDGKGGFGAPIGISLSALPVPEITAADFNGDGLADVAVTDSTAVVVGLNTTSGFKLSISPTELAPLRPGGSANLTVAVGTQNGFNNTVSLACSSPVSAGIHCSVSPSAVSPGSNAILTVTTTGLSAMLGLTYPGQLALYVSFLPFAGLAVFGIGLGAQRETKRKLLVLLLCCLLLAAIFILASCGGGSNSSGGGGTPAGNYTITVTGTSGPTQHSTTVMLKVQ